METIRGTFAFLIIIIIGMLWGRIMGWLGLIFRAIIKLIIKLFFYLMNMIRRWDLYEK